MSASTSSFPCALTGNCYSPQVRTDLPFHRRSGDGPSCEIEGEVRGLRSLKSSPLRSDAVTWKTPATRSVLSQGRSSSWKCGYSVAMRHAFKGLTIRRSCRWSAVRQQPASENLASHQLRPQTCALSTKTRPRRTFQPQFNRPAFASAGTYGATSNNPPPDKVRTRPRLPQAHWAGDRHRTISDLHGPLRTDIHVWLAVTCTQMLKNESETFTN